MAWLFAALAGIGFVEVMFRLPVIGRMQGMLRTVAKVRAVITSSAISDHWKERSLPRYALRLFRGTLMLAVLLAAAFLPFLTLYAISTGLGVSFLDFSLSFAGIAFMTLVAVVYAKARSALVSADL